jgi:hypothetical protein
VAAIAAQTKVEYDQLQKAPLEISMIDWDRPKQ